MEAQIIEYLSHNIVYSDSFDISTQNTLRALGIHPHKLISDPATGFQMMGFSLTKTTFLKNPVLVFRGTALDFNEEDDFSILADLYSDLAGGIGNDQFDANKTKIRGMMTSLKDINNKKVIVSGHSLGGAIAQSVLTFDTGFLKNNLEKIITFQSPGIDYERIEKILKNRQDPKRRIKSYHYRMKSGFVDNAGEVFSPGVIIEYNFADMPDSYFKRINNSSPYEGLGVNLHRGILAHTYFPLKKSLELSEKGIKLNSFIHKYMVGNSEARPIELLRRTPMLFERIYKVFNSMRDNLLVTIKKDGEKDYKLKNAQILIDSLLEVYKIRDSIKRKILEMNKPVRKEYVNFSLISNIERVIMVELLLFDFTIIKIIEHYIKKPLKDLGTYSIDNSTSTKRIVKDIIWSANQIEFDELFSMLNTFRENSKWIKTLLNKRKNELNLLVIP